MTYPTVISSTSPKGGVGKSTTESALALYLERQGYKVLMIDLDNIGSLTNNFQGPGIRKADCSSVLDLFKPTETVGDIKVSAITDKLHLIQGDSGIAEVNRSNSITLITLMDDNLRQKVPNIESYDYVLIDTPAGTGSTVVAALICADYVYSPIDLDNNAIEALAELTKLVKPIKQRMNTKLHWSGFVINRVPKLVRVLGKKVPESLRDRSIYDNLVSTYGDTALLGTIALRDPIKSAISSGRWIEGAAPSAVEAVNEIENFCKNLLETMQ